jgi:hypothetical protein
VTSWHEHRPSRHPGSRRFHPARVRPPRELPLEVVDHAKLVFIPDRRMTYRTSHLRRGIGVLACLAPALLAGASLVGAAAGGNGKSTAALVVMLVATSIGALNFYLSFIRPMISGSRSDDRNVSGVPVVGTLLVVIGTVLGFGSVLCALLGLVVVAVDTGGSLWFLLSTWRDGSFWDDPHRSPI